MCGGLSLHHRLISRWCSQAGAVLLVIVISQDEPRMSVNNKDIIRMHLGYNWLISQKTVPINASFVK